MAAATLVGAQAEAMKSAAKNEGNGSFMAFAGMNMAGQMGGMNAQNLFQMGQQQNQQAVANPTPANSTPMANSWKCECGHENTGKFCMDCGKPMPVKTTWMCSCGTENKGKFCMECGKSAPSGKYQCDKCGWIPADPTKPPKFCPECGDIFDGNDKK